ncbi:S8 family peptidase [Paenibacillus piscarius]|uniref:S8 family peptidase n=1 Tax=Paenibacillus piscarius TaxID=1089681 RepID=UPI003B75C15B
MKDSISLLEFDVMPDDKQKNSGLDMIFASQFWNRNIEGSKVVIAVMDTGIDINHEELKDNIIGGRNFTSDYQYNPNNYLDGNGHGTHVAGIIAAQNKKKYIGVAPKSSLLILKTLNNNGSGSVTNLIQAIYYAINWRGENGEKVNIISMSLGTKNNIKLLHDAIKYAVKNDISIVVASGNDRNGKEVLNYRYPGAYNEVIQVGSVNLTKKLSSFSNSNEQLDIISPGESIYSTFIQNGYKSLSGTSMAAPFVAGALALLIEEARILFKRELTEAELYAQLIKSTSLLFGNPTIEGNGLLNLSKSFT